MKSMDISASPARRETELEWEQWRSAWPTWSKHRRRDLARQAGRMLHTLWAGRIDLVRLLPVCWRVTIDPNGRCGWRLLEHLRRTLPLRHTVCQVMDVLALWFSTSIGIATRAEQISFARAFFLHEHVDRASFRAALRQVVKAARSEAGALATALYRQHFRRRVREKGLAGWCCEPEISLPALQRFIQSAEQDPATVWIKRKLPTRLFRAAFLGREVVIKRHDTRTDAERLRYRFRASRARRACAAGLTLRAIGLPTPEPLAYLEVSRTTSYIVTEWLPRVRSVRSWLLRQPSWSSADWARFRCELLTFYATPYACGFYHDDTKALNILIQPDGAPGQRLWWIDVEGIIPGARLTRYRVLRNLVQLNGSLRHGIPESERWAFLREMAWHFPWLRDPRLPGQLRAWTHRRLRYQIEVRCGP